MRPWSLKSNKSIIAYGVGDRRGDDPSLGHCFDRQLATNAAEIVAIKNVGFAILPQRQYQRSAAVRAWKVEWKRIAAPRSASCASSVFQSRGAK